MKISLICAVAANGVIGNAGTMPWHLPGDLKHFKALTLGKPMIMGRKTFESLPGVLPGRPHIIISRRPQTGLEPPCYGATSLAEALEIAATLLASADLEELEKEAMIIGGGEIYALALECANTLYLTEIELKPEGDTFFPPLDDQWQETSRTDVNEPVRHSFVTYQRSH